MSFMLSQFRQNVLVLLPLLSVLLPAHAWGQSVDDFQEGSYTDGTYTIPYRLFVPTDYDPNQSYPLVLFLHGSGERGTDNRRQLTGQTAPLVFVKAENQAQWPCFMLAPQCPTNGIWDNIGGANPSIWMSLTLDAINDLMNAYSIDPNHLYITGLSLGGFGTWDTITRFPGLFAAAVPIAGGGDPSLAYLCAQTPIWDFHGGADHTVPVQRSREMIAAVIAAGGSPGYTEYPGIDHVGSWNLAYSEPYLLPWLFSN